MTKGGLVVSILHTVIGLVDWMILAPILGALTIIYTAFGRHISNNKRHLGEEKLLSESVCDERVKRIEAIMKAAEKRANERHTELREWIREVAKNAEKQ